MAFVWSAPGSKGIALASGPEVVLTTFHNWPAEPAVPKVLQHTSAVCAGTFNRDGSMLATATMDKSVHLWNCETGLCIGTRAVAKKVTSMAIGSFTTKQSTPAEAVVIGDKLGNAYALPIKNFGKEAHFLLGHTASVLTALRVTSDSRYLISSDRDEKIRISNFPKTHETHSYCLGHTAFVASIVAPASLAADSVLMSSGGEGLICVWNYSSGELISSTSVPTLGEAAGKETEDTANFASRIAYSETRRVLVALAHSGDRIWVYSLQKRTGTDDTDAVTAARFELVLVQTVELGVSGFQDLAFIGDSCLLAVPVPPASFAGFSLEAAASSSAALSDGSSAPLVRLQPLAAAADPPVPPSGGVALAEKLRSLSLAWARVTGKDAAGVIGNMNFRRHTIKHNMHVDMDAVRQKAGKRMKT